MPSIVTLTFSPCIDKSASVPSLIPEKKLNCSDVKLEPGGGGINVARAIVRLGGQAAIIAPCGGYTGKFLQHLIEKENISSVIVETANDTRENIIILDQGANKQYRFGMPPVTLTEHEYQKCLDALNDTEGVEFIIVSGSFPSVVPTAIFTQLATIANRKKAKLIVDTSGKALKEAMASGVYLVKPNLAELCALAGVDKIDISGVEENAKAVLKNYNCCVMVVSLGKDGAMLITRDEVQITTPPDVKIKSTVGAGDSLVAGVVCKLAGGHSLQEALQYGVACGTAATMNPGTELCHKEDADALYLLIKESQFKV